MLGSPRLRKVKLPCMRTSHPVCSDRLRIRTSGVLPIRAGRPSTAPVSLPLPSPKRCQPRSSCRRSGARGRNSSQNW